MNRVSPAAVLGTCALLVSGAAAATDPDDLDRIPAPVNAQPPGAPATPANDIVYFQADTIATARRNDLIVALPPPPAPRWEERLFADARVQWTLSDDVDFVYSGRLNLRVEDGLEFPNHENIRHDLREGYLSWSVDGSTFLDLGRINLKSGVALGFNPTDFFKTRAVVEPLSADPSVLREDRLGTLMLYGQHLWNGGAVSLAFAPKTTTPSPIYLNTNLPSFDPVFDRTNSATRLLAKGSIELFDDFSPEMLAYAENGRWDFGANLTRGFGQSVVGYLEWAGGDRTSLAESALVEGKETGTLPGFAPSLLPTGPAPKFQNDIALGLSYATQNRITFNLEYHYHQAGFSGADWRTWFAAGTLRNGPLDAELWYIRDYALDRQEPVNRREAFLRADWQDAFVPDLDLTGFLVCDVRDASVFGQFTADYNLSRLWSIGGLAGFSVGGTRSDFGSLPTGSSFLLKATRYL